MANQKKALGRGLSSIISAGGKNADDWAKSLKKSPKKKDDSKKVSGSSNALFKEISIDKIIPSPYQARKVFKDEHIKELAESISSEGLLQPILVRQLEDSTFELLAGERRYRACKLLNLKKILAYVQTSSDASAAAKGLIENIQRADLNPIETAKGIANMMANFNLTQEAVSQRLGMPRSSIANFLRLLTLDEQIQNFISNSLISMGHAKVLISVEDKENQLILARKIIENGINVRNTEDLAKNLKSSASNSINTKQSISNAQNTVIRDIQHKISTKLNANVQLKHNAKHGKIIIDYFGNDDLQRILELFGIKN